MTLILTGIVTSGVVLSTLRHAADADYRRLVVGVCCSDCDEEAHRVLLEKVFPRHHHDGCGTRAGYRGRAVDAVAPCASVDCYLPGAALARLRLLAGLSSAAE